MKKNINKCLFKATWIPLFCILFHGLAQGQNNDGVILMGEPQCTCTPSTPGSVEVQAQGTAGPFNFQWEGPNGYTSNAQSPNDLASPGQYSVTVTNLYGCEKVLTTNILHCTEPYIKKVTVVETIGNNIIYEAEWVQTGNCITYIENEQVAQLTVEELQNAGLTITAIASKQLISSSVQLPGLIPPVASGTSPTFDNITWEFSFLPGIFSTVTNDNLSQQLNFFGQDLSGNKILDLRALSNNLAECVALPHLQSDCIWSSPPETGIDDVHILEIECMGASFTSITNPSSSDNDGSFVLEITGTPPFTISMQDPNGNPSGGTININTFEQLGLAPGTYCIRILSSSGCMIERCITLCRPPHINSDLTLPCLGESNGKICLDITPSIPSQNGAYSTNWWNGTNLSCVEDLPAGNNYCVSVTDNNCTVPVNAENCFDLPSYTATTSINTTNTSSGNCDGSIELTNIPGDPPYSILIEGTNSSFSVNGFNTSYIFEGLCLGDYSIVITNLSGNNCEELLEATIGVCAEISMGVPQITDATSCNEEEGSDGVIDLDPSLLIGGTTPYTFLWSNGTTEPIISNLSPGSYTLTVTDALGCQAENSYIVGVQNSSNFIFDFEITTVQDDLNGDCQGSITTYTFLNTSYPVTLQLLWNYTEITVPVFPNPSTSYTFENLCAGTHTITAEYTAFNGESCAITTEIEIVSCPDFTLTSPEEVAKPSSCTASDGYILFDNADNPIGGTPPYLWNWSNGMSTPYQISNLEPGIYSLTLVDNAGCMIEQTFDLSLPNDANLVQIINITQPDGACNGSITISGAPGIHVVLMPEEGGPVEITMTDDTFTFYELCVDNYTILLTDEVGCENQLEEELVECLPITMNDPKIIHPTSCLAADADGVIWFKFGGAEGGVSPYQIVLKDKNGNAFPQWNFNEHLAEGVYTIHVTDAVGCTAEFSYELESPSTPSLLSTSSPQCEGLQNGEIGIAILNPSGNSYTYSWSTGQTIQTSNSVIFLENLLAGSYSLTVTDTETGCSKSITENVELLPSTGEYKIVSTNFESSCPFQATGSISIEISGGNPPYSISTNNGQNDYYGSVNVNSDGIATYTLSNIPAGGYHSIVLDNYCKRPLNTSIIVDEYPPMELSYEVIKTCNDGLSDIDVNVSGGASPFSFAWSNGVNENQGFLEGVPSDTYSVTVTDNNQCFQIIDNILVEETPPIDIEFDKESICEYRPFQAASENSLILGGTITANVTGGLLDQGSDYLFKWELDGEIVLEGEGENKLIQIFDTDEYTLTVSDKCEPEIRTVTPAFKSIWDTDFDANSCKDDIECDGRLIQNLPVGYASSFYPANQGDGVGQWIFIDDNCFWYLYCVSGAYDPFGPSGQATESIEVYEGYYSPVEDDPNPNFCHRVTYCVVEVNTSDPNYHYPIVGTAYKEIDRDIEGLVPQEYTESQGQGFLECTFTIPDGNGNPIPHEKLKVVFCGDIPIYQECIELSCPEADLEYTFLGDELPNDPIDDDQCQINITCISDENYLEIVYPTETCVKSYITSNGERKFHEVELCLFGTIREIDVILDPVPPENIITTELCCIKYQYPNPCPMALVGNDDPAFIISDVNSQIQADIELSDNNNSENYEAVIENKIYPNPFTGITNLEYWSKEDQSISIRLFNLTGKSIFTTTLKANKGLNKFTFEETTGLSSGIYFLRVMDNNSKSMTFRLIKL